MSGSLSHNQKKTSSGVKPNKDSNNRKNEQSREETMGTVSEGDVQIVMRASEKDGGGSDIKEGGGGNVERDGDQLVT